jgi:hypothetical protein
MELRLKNYRSVVTLLFLLLFSPLSGMAQQSAAPAGPAGLTRTGSGLVLQQSGVNHIQSVMGPTLVFRIDLTADASHMCYTATTNNSLIAFEIEDQVITRIQVMADRHQYNSWDWCTAMPLSAEDLSLANGVALGLEPTDVRNLLGAPRNEEGDRWHYRYRLKKSNGQERLRPREELQDYCGRLDIEFTGSRLSRFDLRIRSIDGGPAGISP